MIVVLPAYNEATNIGQLIESIDNALHEAKLDYEVIVVEDGSKDETLAVLESYRSRYLLTVHRHDANQGLGATIRDGLREASRIAEPDDVVITMDADGTHLPGLIPRMTRMIHEGYDVVIASRYQRGARVHGLSPVRKLMSWCASWLFRIVFPTPGVRDFTSGYRAYRGKRLNEAIAHYGDHFVEADGFQCMAEILLKLRQFDVIFGEAPMILRYDLKKGASKMRVFPTIKNTLVLLVRRRLS